MAYGRYARPRLAEMLGAIHLDVVYHRGEGDFLWYRDRAGREIRVIDMLGGFGATLLGHNHPALLSRAKELLDARVVHHAQASVRGYTAELAERLSRMVGERTGYDYVVTFTNSGAEAVEAALKHAEMELWAKRERKLARLRHTAARAKQDFVSGRVRFANDSAAREARLRQGGIDCRD